jgi:hypothetical protein
MNDIYFRPATLEDAPVIAQITLIAADGLVKRLMDNLLPGTSTEEMLMTLIAHESGEASYRNIEVAMSNSAVVAMGQSYAAERRRITEEMEIPFLNIAVFYFCLLPSFSILLFLWFQTIL